MAEKDIIILTMAKEDFLGIDTCSWKHDSWQGLIYPQGNEINYLQEFSRHFSTVEVDQWFWFLFKGDTVILPKTEVVREVPLVEVKVGDRLRVIPGDKVPVDGEVVEGHSSIEESMVTGESMLEEKSAGDKVTGGTVNDSGSFVMTAERVGNDTLLGGIVKMVADAQRSRAPNQSLADKVTEIIVPEMPAPR